MTKHMRLVVSVLFIVIIVLAVAITRFYSSTGKSTELSGTQPAIEKILDDDKSGNHIFQNDSGMYGIIDSNNLIIRIITADRLGNGASDKAKTDKSDFFLFHNS